MQFQSRNFPHSNISKVKKLADTVMEVVFEIMNVRDYPTKRLRLTLLSVFLLNTIKAKDKET